MSEEQVPTVTIDGEKYALADISEKGQYVISQIKWLQNELEENRRTVDRHAMALDAFNAVLKTEVADIPVEVQPDNE